MSDSARNRANGFETLGGNKNNFNKQFSTGGKAPNPFKSGGSGNSTAGLKLLGVIAVLILLIIVAWNSAYKIGEQEQGVLVTFGQAQPITEPGLHFKIPFAQQIRKVNTTIQGFSIGYDMASNQSKESESLMITSDYNFVNVDFFVEYRYSDPVKALYASKNPVEILKNVSKSCIRTVISGYPVDAVLTTGKGEIQSSIKERIISDLERQDIGIQLVNITIQDSEPPTQTIMEAFKAVETAKQGKETSLNNANKYRNEQIPSAQARADGIIKNAEAKKTERINEATAQVARFNAMYAEYVKNPLVTRERMFYETMESVLPGLKIVIEGTNGETQTVLPLESFIGDAPLVSAESVTQ
ncbi:MAG: FtsH protease activity modulator HflK [Lachnospiraceae bacterium]|nr:FtsH protease activity modulator HflK [Lachnospiraceae bacterium]MBR3507379.1 FtsH protease activity modulator HflK [Lachnospiraceae bacterium]MBR4607985.1 FtsH protease activity modulator HflK [Lachnospiraceae bacterium]